MDRTIRPFQVDIPQSDLDDLLERLHRTRWANELPNSPESSDWDYGVPVSYVRELLEYWRSDYDWRKWEAKLNSYPQFLTEIDDQTVHFIHVRSREAGATPLILTHGWPNSVVEYLELIDQLTDPRAHGGKAAEAFHVVIPSIPGFGFSGPTHEKGWDRHRIARAWAELMRRLGYRRYGAHGNDAGALIAPELGRLDSKRVIGVHVTQLFSFPSGDPAELESLTEEEIANLQFLQSFFAEKSAFAQLQSTQPQNLAHALADSPAGQLAWSGQLFGRALTPDQILTNVTIYWLTNTAASSARLYYEDHHTSHPTEPTTVPTGLASFANDFTPLRKLAERDHRNIVHWSEFDRGGHWASHDAPDLLVADIRKFFRKVKTTKKQPSASTSQARPRARGRSR